MTFYCNIFLNDFYSTRNDFIYNDYRFSFFSSRYFLFFMTEVSTRLNNLPPDSVLPDRGWNLPSPYLPVWSRKTKTQWLLLLVTSLLRVMSKMYEDERFELLISRRPHLDPMCPDLKRERYTHNANSSTYVRMVARAAQCVCCSQRFSEFSLVEGSLYLQLILRARGITCTHC